jgi:hypothetical protein
MRRSQAFSVSWRLSTERSEIKVFQMFEAPKSIWVRIMPHLATTLAEQNWKRVGEPRGVTPERPIS